MVPHLILHKVRGEPAFDVGHEIEAADGQQIWIVSTSGHRAYPIMVWNLEDLADISDINAVGNHNRPADFEPQTSSDWEGLQDHYAVMPTAPTKSLDQLLAKIGFAKAPAIEAVNGVRMRR